MEPLPLGLGSEGGRGGRHAEPMKRRAAIEIRLEERLPKYSANLPFSNIDEK